MSMNWVVFIVAIYLIGIVLGTTMSGGSPFASAGTTYNNSSSISDINAMSQPSSSPLSFIGTFFHVATMDFAFFHGYDNRLQILRWICMLPIIVAVSYGLTVFIMSIFRGTGGSL